MTTWEIERTALHREIKTVVKPFTPPASLVERFAVEDADALQLQIVKTVGAVCNLEELRIIADSICATMYPPMQVAINEQLGYEEKSSNGRSQLTEEERLLCRAEGPLFDKLSGEEKAAMRKNRGTVCK